MKIPVQSLLSIALGLLIETLAAPNANALQWASAQTRGHPNGLAANSCAPVAEAPARGPANDALDSDLTRPAAA
ncbi:MAG: hypothetical protein AAB466_03785 [Verrucomicrobiota bacterium]